MTPFEFERRHRDTWQRLRTLLPQFQRHKARRGTPPALEFVTLYRRCCEHLALARSRDYPEHLIAPLETLTSAAHQLIYRRNEWGWSRLQRLWARDFPRAVHRHAAYVWIAAALMLLPTLIMGVLVYRRPDLINTVADVRTVSQFQEMYARAADLPRNASTDWTMFGYYIGHNIGLSFQCFAGGLFFGVGSVFFLIYNGVFGGAVAGYLTARDLGPTFYAFVVTHSAFELTAIVLSGAAGLRMGHAMLSPGRRSRRQALADAGREAIVVMYGVIAMLLIAAAIEAFWSSAAWMPMPLKYTVAALSWTAVLGYLWRQARRAD